MTDSFKELDIESQELLWVDCCECACSEIQAKHYKAAMDYWQESLNLAESFSDSDPRHAASLNNMAVVFRLRNNLELAEKYYQLAKQQWAAAADWVKCMEIRSRASSSVFHLRMERRHREKYNKPIIEDYLNKLDAGYAATLNNHAELLQKQDKNQQARAQYALALDKRIKSNLTADTGAKRIASNLHASLNDNTHISNRSQNINRLIEPSSLNFIEKARRENWLIDKPPIFTDEGRLMAALLFTYIIEMESSH